MNSLTKNFIIFACLNSIEHYLICPPEKPLDKSSFEIENPMIPPRNTPPPKAILARTSSEKLSPGEGSADKITPDQPVKKRPLVKQPSKIVRSNPVADNEIAIAQAKITIPKELESLKKNLSLETEGLPNTNIIYTKSPFGFNIFEDVKTGKKWYSNPNSLKFFKVVLPNGSTILLDADENPEKIINPPSTAKASTRYILVDDPETVVAKEDPSKNQNNQHEFSDNGFDFTPRPEDLLPEKTSSSNSLLLKLQRFLANLSVRAIKSLSFLFKDPEAKVASIKSYKSKISMEQQNVKKALLETEKSLQGSLVHLQKNMSDLLESIEKNEKKIDIIEAQFNKIEKEAQTKIYSKSDKLIAYLQTPDGKIGTEAQKYYFDLANDISKSTEKIIFDAKERLNNYKNSRAILS